nr:P31 protein [Ageratum virus 1]
MANSLRLTSATAEELLQVLHGEVSCKELRSLGCGVLTPARGGSSVTSTPLIPPRTHSALRSLFHLDRGKYLYVPFVAVVVIPTVPDRIGGLLRLHLIDTGLADADPICGQVTVNLANGPCIGVFYPTYSIPLHDGTNSHPRQFRTVCQLTGTTVPDGTSPYTTYWLWGPEVSSRVHQYLSRPPTLCKLTRGRVREVLVDELRASASTALVGNSFRSLTEASVGGKHGRSNRLEGRVATSFSPVPQSHAGSETAGDKAKRDFRKTSPLGASTTLGTGGSNPDQPPSTRDGP